MLRLLLLSVFCILFNDINAQIHWVTRVDSCSNPSLYLEYEGGQVIGEPNAMPHGVFHENAWTMRFEGEEPQWIGVSFRNEIPIHRVFVVENQEVSLKNIYLYDIEGKLCEKLTLNDNIDLGLNIKSKISYVSLYKPTDYKVKHILLEVFPPFFGDSCQVDAIGISEWDIDYQLKTNPNTSKIEESFVLNGNVYNKKTGRLESDVYVDVTDLRTGETRDSIYCADGSFKIKLKDESIYQVKVKKHSFFSSKAKTIFTVGHNKSQVLRADFEIEKIEPDSVYRMDYVEFDPNTATITRNGRRSLKKFKSFMEDNPTIVVDIGVHTDSRGDDDYNLKLTQQQAVAIRKYLIKKGIGAERLTAKGYGETKLINHCANGVKCSNSTHLENRRIEYIILKY